MRRGEGQEVPLRLAGHKRAATRKRPAPWRIGRRRRARLAGVESEPFGLEDVIARDGWRCGICGGKVDPKAKGARGKSLDHIVPVSLGGPHTLANAQLAHMNCNSQKGAGAAIPSQLRMFG